ncbi:hypothetical protein [Bradyrhizobium sp. ARR65]|uniref:hypothetical protein n=1 Tax=Bradyrhizobium sp. ARR65 TaxID=1040989 RepID=UPI000AEBE368|nr:hypothetical protein [Bradyrhizobium sp. ARR65]
MPTKDGFDPNHTLPLFLCDHTDEHEQRGTSRYFKASIFAVAATATAVAITLLLGNPARVFADVMASLTDSSLSQPGTNQATPTIQNSADAQVVHSKDDAQVSAPAASEVPTHDEIAAAPQPPGQNQTGSDQSSSEALFSQFQAWAAKQDTQEQKPAQPLESPRAPPAQVVENNRLPEQPTQKHRKSAQNARHVQKHRASVHREQNARVEARPAQDAGAQEPPAQNAQAPSVFQGLGWHQ